MVSGGLMETMMLPDLLAPGLRMVVCGTAPSQASASRRQYYAGRGNKFWPVLATVGMTPRQLDPCEYELLSTFGIGLTDVTQGQAGMDKDINFAKSDRGALEEKILIHKLRYLCFNGKRAAMVFLKETRVSFGPQSSTIGATRLFVAPSTSGAANASWDLGIWQKMADIALQAKLPE